MQPDDVAIVKATYADLDRWGELTMADRAALAGGDWFGAADRVTRFLLLANGVIRDATPHGKQLVATDKTKASADWLGELERLAQAMTTLRKAAR